MKRRVTKELARLAAESGNVVCSDSGLAVEVVGNSFDMNDGKCSVVIARLCQQHEPLSLMGWVTVVFSTEYPFKAPEVRLFPPVSCDHDGSDALSLFRNLTTTVGSNIDCSRSWSPAVQCKRILEAIALPPPHIPLPLRASLAWTANFARIIYEAATSGRYNLIWLSAGCGCNSCGDKSGATWRPVMLPALESVGGAYYYQHLPSRVQQRAAAADRVLVLLIDPLNQYSDPPEWPNGFDEAYGWTREESLPLGVPVFSHVGLDIHVAKLHEEVHVDDTSVCHVLQAAAAALSQGGGMLWVSEFFTEINGISTSINGSSSGACRVSHLVESSSGMFYLDAFRGALSDGTRHPLVPCKEIPAWQGQITVHGLLKVSATVDVRSDELLASVVERALGEEEYKKGEWTASVYQDWDDFKKLSPAEQRVRDRVRVNSCALTLAESGAAAAGCVVMVYCGRTARDWVWDVGAPSPEAEEDQTAA
jgi:hypothetical protein